VRDRAGEKPLCYHQAEDGIYFASELRPLIKGPNDHPQIDLDALYLYLLLRYVPAPFALYKGYSKVRPGHYLKIEPGKLPREYAFFSWDPHASEIQAHPKNFTQAVRITEQLLVKALDQRLMSDVPLGFFLSGGVDSTLAAALVRKHFGRPIHTYTIGFEGDSESEHPVSEQTAKLIGATHKTRIFKQKELGDISRQVIRSMDEPNGDRSCVPTYLLCGHAKSEVTVALGGDGGDELFGGYSRYPGLNQRIGEDLYPRAYDGLMNYLSTALPVFGANAAGEIFEGIPAGAEEYLQSLAVPLYSPCRAEIDIRYVDFNSYLPGAILSKVDRMSMQHSLEVRTPFFGKQLFEIASRMPHEFLYQGSYMKPVLRQICTNLGLSHVAQLKKKGFGMPAEFLYANRAELEIRVNNASASIIDTIGTKLSTKALQKSIAQNMNSVWSTVVLGEWLEATNI
jgi:asparagine synthase (glutamine-hydrolysing)